MRLQYLSDYPGIFIGGDALDDEDGFETKPLSLMEQALFMSATRQCLGMIRSKPVGKDLLRLISQRCQGIGSRGGALTCTIYMSGGTLVGSRKTWAKYQKGAIGGTHAPETGQPGSLRTMRGVRARQGGYQMSIAGVGRSATVGYNPFVNYNLILQPILGVPTPPFIALAHELVHCLHTLSGDVVPDEDEDRADLLEEARTVGAGRFENTRISENAIRREHAIPPRDFYMEPGDCNL